MPVQAGDEGGATPIFSESTELKILLAIGVVIVLFAIVETVGLLMSERTRLGRWARGGNKRTWRSPTPELFRLFGRR